MDDLLPEFIAETRETLAAISGEIVAWEADPADRARLDAIFRFVHTVKGSCGFLDLPRLARLSHGAEDVLQRARSGERVPDAQLVNAVLAIIDRIGEIVEAIDSGAALDDSGEDLLLAALEEHAPAASSRMPTSVVSVPRAPTRSIRLSVDLLDRMMNGVSEMVLARNELARRLRETGDPTLETAVDRLSLTVAELRDTVTRTRMQAIESLFSSLPRLVRDTAASLGKKVALSIDGADVELDREMIELLRDPLVHMVRNALDHGIETPEERRRAGKPDTGRLAIVARQSGNRIIVELADDGRGIDTARLVDKRIAQEPARAAEFTALGEAARLDLVFEPGLSTRDEVTAISGRGVGMDVVRTNVEQIGGSIRLDNKPGRGLTSTIQVPLTLAIVSVVTIEIGGICFAIARQAIDEIIAVKSDAVQIARVGDTMLATVRGRRLPLVALGDVLGVNDTPGPMLMIVTLPAGTYALSVDGVIDTEELVVKPVAPAVMTAGVYAGQMLPDTGRPLLLLDCAGIAAAAGVSFDRVTETAQDNDEPARETLPALLFEGVDGQQRAIALSAVDRIETVAPALLRQAAGRWWTTTAAGIVQVLVDGAPPTEGNLSMLLINQAPRPTAFLVREALEIVQIADEPLAVDGPGAVVGIFTIDGDPIELIDPLRLSIDPLPVAAIKDVIAPEEMPICLLHGADTIWIEAFLRPTIEAAGYRVAHTLASGETATITLSAEEEATPGEGVLRVARDASTGQPHVDPEALAQMLGAGAGR